MPKKLSSTMEDYLEVIAVLKKRSDRVARVRDIANMLGVKSPTVNAALKTLSRKGLVVHEKYGYVDLTSVGESVAREVQNKHNTLVQFLTFILGIDEPTALDDACKMEHAISSTTSSRLRKLIDFAGAGLYAEDPQWLKNFKYYIETGKRVRCDGEKKNRSKKEGK